MIRGTGGVKPPQPPVNSNPGGDYHYFGIEKSIMELIECNDIEAQCCKSSTYNLNLQINIDGLPLFKSSAYQLWPILGILIQSKSKVPFVICMFGAKNKPDDLGEFLLDSVSEMDHLKSNGFIVDEKNMLFLSTVSSVMLRQEQCLNV